MCWGALKVEGNTVEFSNKRLTITVDGALGAACTWVLSVSLMVWDTIAELGHGTVARWSLLVGLMAAVWTLALVISHARRVVLEVMSYEFRTRDKAAAGEDVVSIGRQR